MSQIIQDIVTPGGNPLEIVLKVIVIFLIAYLANKMVQRASRWYAKKLSTQEARSVGWALRTKRKDTLSRVVAAILRMALALTTLLAVFLFAFPHQGSSVLGATLVLALVGFAIQPLIRDMIAGTMMMAEDWFTVGDQVWVEPSQVGGIVEHFNLRSTQLRTLSGERVIIHNGNIWSASVSRQGTREMVMEIIVREKKPGEDLVYKVSSLLPKGPAQVVHKLQLVDSERLGEDEDILYRLTCRATVAPGREWLLEDFAVKVFAEQDAMRDNIIMHGPIVYYADEVAEKRARQSIAWKRAQAQT